MGLGVLSLNSSIVGNLITDDGQWRKLALVQKVATEVWGN
jgi:hypothetical protein